MLKGDFWYTFFFCSKQNWIPNIICIQKRIAGQKRFWNPKKLFDPNQNFKCKMELRSKVYYLQMFGPKGFCFLDKQLVLQKL